MYASVCQRDGGPETTTRAHGGGGWQVNRRTALETLVIVLIIIGLFTAWIVDLDPDLVQAYAIAVTLAFALTVAIGLVRYSRRR